MINESNESEAKRSWPNLTSAHISIRIIGIISIPGVFTDCMGKWGYRPMRRGSDTILPF